MATVAQLTQDELLQRRRELASKTADLTAQLESQRQTVASLGAVLRATNVETRASREQKRLTAIREELFRSERALASFDEQYPGLELMELLRTQV